MVIRPIIAATKMAIAKTARVWSGQGQKRTRERKDMEVSGWKGVAVGERLAIAFVVAVTIGALGVAAVGGDGVAEAVDVCVGAAVEVAVGAACSWWDVGEAPGMDVGDGTSAVEVRVAAVIGVDVGGGVSVGAEVTRTEVEVKAGSLVFGESRVAVAGPGVGERVGTVWRAGSWVDVAQATPESEPAKIAPPTSSANSH
jgi:hypothetical protein